MKTNNKKHNYIIRTNKTVLAEVASTPFHLTEEFKNKISYFYSKNNKTFLKQLAIKSSMEIK
jgi:hypothetical protein